MIFAGVFPDTVEHNDRVIQRIAYDGQEGRNNWQGKFFIGQGEDSHCNKHVVYQGHYSSHSEFQLQIKAQGQRDQHCDDNQNRDAHTKFGKYEKGCNQA